MAAGSQEELLLPLFPLPNLVFFPKTRLPLHIFEPRYLQMISDILSRDSRVGLVLLKSGWEQDYYGNPPIHSFGTIGQIEQAAKLEDGRFNLLVHGTTRYRILEVISEDPYRTARVSVEPERAVEPMEAYAQREWLAELSKRYIEFMPGRMEVPELETVGLDSLTNALIMSLDIDLEEKQRFLEVDSVVARAEGVGNELQRRIEDLQFLSKYRRGDPERN
ncbi:MAG: LON peptidase substrate-binding domain-containing protein [Acidobacteriota bacterium]